HTDMYDLMAILQGDACGWTQPNDVDCH
ncbi:hypothetical protein A2U01_0090531, partial [Trifolium medium]|nr:hypothetical protein [Trifolium medium]